jgi:hypothetical protein
MQDNELNETGARWARCAGQWGQRAAGRIAVAVTFDDDGFAAAAYECAVMAAHCARPVVEGLALGRLYGAGRPS